MKSRLLRRALTATLLAGLSTAALAHQPWLLTEPGRTEVGASVTVMPFHGHEFPFDDAMRPERIAEIVLLTADGERISIDGPDRITPELSEGVHAIGLRQVRSYWSRTTEGGRAQPRPELENVISCSYSDNSAKTLVIVGNGQASAGGQALGHRLEILTDADLGQLRPGDAVSFTVLLEGSPHAGPVMAFHANSGEDPWLTTESDHNGHVEFTLEGPGPWMVLARGEVDYPDPAVCDVERFVSTLSFGHTSVDAAAR